MYLGLKCDCGHEFNFIADEVEFLVKGIPMVMACSRCKKYVYLTRNDDYLGSYRILEIDGDLNKEGESVKFNFDPQPISVSGIVY